MTRFCMSIQCRPVGPWGGWEVVPPSFSGGGAVTFESALQTEQGRSHKHAVVLRCPLDLVNSTAWEPREVILVLLYELGNVVLIVNVDGVSLATTGLCLLP